MHGWRRPGIPRAVQPLHVDFPPCVLIDVTVPCDGSLRDGAVGDEKEAASHM